MESYKCKVLSSCHNKRNRAEYDGEFEIEEALLDSLIEVTQELFEKLDGFDPFDE